jgi:hypothetical protein
MKDGSTLPIWIYVTIGTLSMLFFFFRNTLYAWKEQGKAYVRSILYKHLVGVSVEGSHLNTSSTFWWNFMMFLDQNLLLPVEAGDDFTLKDAEEFLTMEESALNDDDEAEAEDNDEVEDEEEDDGNDESEEDEDEDGDDDESGDED